MDDDLSQSQNTLDPFDEFLAQLLLDIPNTLPSPTSTATPAHAFAPAPESTAAPEPAPLPDPQHYLTCQWVSHHDPPFLCGTPLPPDAKDVCAHFRLAHNVRGNDKVTVDCHWHTCRAPPMQRGSLIRHILAVHLGLLRWRCELCGRVFSRKWTSHICGDGASS